MYVYIYILYGQICAAPFVCIYNPVYTTEWGSTLMQHLHKGPGCWAKTPELDLRMAPELDMVDQWPS